jgi:hypothetical protein
MYECTYVRKCFVFKTIFALLKHIDLVWWPSCAPGFGVFLELVLTDNVYVHVRRWIVLLKEVINHQTNRARVLKF